MTVSYCPEGKKIESLPSCPSSGETDKRSRICIHLECVPLQSLYNVESVQLENQTFYMRHSMYCSYSYMHPNAIPLLGYLPQDMNGMSIFDFYHKDDMETLYNIYRQIVVSKGTPFKSKPIRLRTRNGCWLTVETEWSSFANPWSHRLEFIIGQHRLVKPPIDGNVFNEPDRPLFMSQLSDYQQMLQQKIRQMLLEPVTEGKVITPLQSRADSSDEQKTSEEEPEKAMIKNKQQIEKYTDRKAGKSPDSLQSAESIGISSIQTFPEHETSMAYEQLNYANSIKRYLMSQQKTYSSSSEKKATSEEETDTPCTISTTTAEPSDSEFEVDISVPKPPSFGSSTKVLLSEQEQREDVAGSPAHQIEDNTEDATISPGAPVPIPMPPPPPPVESPDTFKPVTLTQDALLRHTKQQEDLFVAHAKQDRSPIMLKSKQGEHLQERKRSHSPDQDKGMHRPNKASRGDSSILIPPFPLPSIGCTQCRQGSTSRDKMCHRSYRNGNKNEEQYTTSLAGLPVCTTKPSQSNKGCRVTPAPGNVMWPYYPQLGSGASFYPQVMGGFYQESSGPPATLSFNVSSSMPSPANTNGTTVAGTGRHNLQVLQGHCQGPFHLPSITTSFSSSSDMSISHTDSGSSYLYLLDSDDQNSGQEVDTKAKENKSNKRQTEPPWLENICWNKKLAMNYQLPNRKKNRVLKSDKAFITASEASSVLLQQMMELQSDIEQSQGAPVIDEECDYLFYEEEEPFSDCDSRLISLEDIHEALSRCENHEDGIGCYKELKMNSEQNKKPLGKKSSDPNMDVSLESEVVTSSVVDDRIATEQVDGMDCQTENQPPLETQTPLDSQEPLDTQGPLDSLTMDIESNCSKTSSDLTPSDERSSGEAGSSVKESDATSSKGSLDEGKDSSESDVDVGNSTRKDFFDMFFVIPPIFFVNHCTTPFWNRNFDMTPLMEMEYTVNAKNPEKCLGDDMRSIRNVVQPDLVKKQMNFMMEELNLFKKSPEESDTKPQETVTGRKESRCSVDSSSVKKPASQLRCKPEPVLTEDVFNSLFVNMFNEDLPTSCKERSPDIEDISDSLDEVD
ncbi:period circadian protein homolog 1-like isoform X1 [Saccostrea echinata]|uniref:period circadian protein homolog 1-like isoform X1 n=1 Tax=Saccostrea echinata TaxID=191078 RepID=UPI002A83E418|nr:period circadian protein homolog 1-like isoform X1 [Saccostrea echinata]